MTAKECTFDRCSSAAGGVVYMADDQVGDITFTNSVFKSCKTSHFSGGCIYAMSGSVTVQKCSIESCETAGTGGFIFFNGFDRYKLTMHSTTAKSCKANWNAGCTGMQNGDLDMRDCTISDSTGADGGGITILDSHGTCNIYNTVIKNCIAPNGGGGLRIVDANYVFVERVNISGCSSTGSGGGVKISNIVSRSVTFVNVKIEDCRCDGSGGGLFCNVDVNLRFERVIFSRCQAASGRGCYFDAVGSLQWSMLCFENCGNTPVVKKSGVSATMPSGDQLVWPVYNYCFHHTVVCRNCDSRYSRLKLDMTVLWWCHLYILRA